MLKIVKLDNVKSTYMKLNQSNSDCHKISREAQLYQEQPWEVAINLKEGLQNTLLQNTSVQGKWRPQSLEKLNI